jgi:uncharacterized ion transporter superfamily protein YfcC
MATPEKPARSFPHPFALLLLCVVLATVLTWVLPAGEFRRSPDPASGRDIVVAGSYQRVPASPLGPLAMLMAVPKGIVAGADIMMLVFIMGGAFTVVDRAGALRGGFDALVRALGRHEVMIVPIAALFFGAGGVLFNMGEEIIAMIPVLVLVVARLGFDPLVAVGMSTGAAAVGSAFSPMNPFQVLIAQQVAQLPLLSGAAFRSAFLALALLVWVAAVMRFALRTRAPAAAVAPALGAAGVTSRTAAATEPGAATFRHLLTVALVFVTFTIYVYGALRLEWGFNELGAIFLLLGIIAGLIGRLGVNGTARAYVEGFRDMALAAMLIGVARAIFVVLSEGRVIDTIVQGLFQPLAALPPAVAALGMLPVHTLIHVPVPSVSGHAVLTMPILVPLADLLGISRQVTVLAYQYGAGLGDLINPTSGALMAVLAAGGIRYDRWLRFVLPLWGLMMLVGAVSVVVALAVGLE